MENVPGGDMEELATLSYEADPKHFLQVVLDKLEKHHPTTYDRIDTARFDLAQPQDLLQGGVVPTVRNTVVEFDGGKCAIALGDVHSVVDPMMGQGANVASYAAFVLGEEIVNADVLDARFCEKVDLKRQDRVLAASRWTNMMLQPPSEALGMLIGTMSQNQALADEFTENFNYPDRAVGPRRVGRAHPCLDRPHDGAAGRCGPRREGHEMQRADPLAFRHAASRFVTGVAVLTALDSHGEVCGMTANSFVTISLSPPTVLVSVKPGRMHDAMSASGRYGVNVLPEQAKALSRHFAGQPREAFPDYEIVEGLPRLSNCVAFSPAR